MENKEVDKHQKSNKRLQSINSENKKEVVRTNKNNIDQLKDYLKVLADKNPKVKEQLNQIGNKLKVIKFKDGVEEKIKSGEYIWDGKSAEVRKSGNHRIASKITFEDPESIDKMKKDIEINEVAEKIEGIIGQAQLYNISEKIEKLTKKIDDIFNDIKDFNDAKLESALDDLKLIIIDGKYSDNEINRINTVYLDRFKVLSKYFEKKLVEQIGNDIYESEFKKLLNKFHESIIFFRNNDYESEKIVEQFKLMNYSWQGYILSTLALIKSYELIGEYSKAEVIKGKFTKKVEKYEGDCAEYIVFVLKDNKTSISEMRKLKNVISNNENFIDSKILHGCTEMLQEIEQVGNYMNAPRYLLENTEIIDNICDIKSLKED